MNSIPDENELLRLLMLLSDTQAWLNELSLQCVNGLHPPGIKLLNGKTYRLSITALAHIIERHYYKTMRHPGTGKFNIPVASIMEHLKEAAVIEGEAMKGCTHVKRCLDLKEPIGFNKSGEAAYRMVIITDAGGSIVTAYPE